MFRLPATSLGLLAAAAAGVALVARYLPIGNHPVLVLAALAPYLMLGAPVAVLIFLVARRWIPAAVALTLTGALALTQAPLFVADRAPEGDGVGFRVMSANIFLGLVDPQPFVELAIARADVLSVQELTPDAVRLFGAAGLDEAFPYRIIDPRPGASGTGVWSRFPITESRSIPGQLNATTVARIRVPGAEGDQTVFSVHPPGPYPNPLDPWRRALADLPAILQEAAAVPGSRCVVVAGDFNSTTDMVPFRRLLTGGYRDAAEQTGAGIVNTYPGNIEHVPPLVAIDHVLTHGCTATSLEVITLPGSDHRGLVVDVHLRK
ncbi:MAG: endonuclease/exonuclease/phosphatase family protein [Mycobacterium sp.]|jgi:endonuclease/exonuclease/phosphatase (EEP) superfamily protein YafD